MIIIHFILSDINECTAGVDANNCSTAAFCTNNEGGFTCQCKPGFTGDGYNCTGKLILFCLRKFTQVSNARQFKGMPIYINKLIILGKEVGCQNNYHQFNLISRFQFNSLIIAEFRIESTL